LKATRGISDLITARSRHLDFADVKTIMAKWATRCGTGLAEAGSRR
jgi:cell division GTPase FtsZ